MYIETVSKEELYHLYIELCLPMKEIADKLNTSLNHIRVCCHKYNIKKTQEQKLLTYKLKTGYDSPLHNPEIQQKARKSFKKKTGYDNPAYDPAIKIKKKKTYKKKTGYDNPSQNPEVKKKKEQTCLLHFGVKNPSQSNKILKKKQETWFKNSGYTHPLKNPDIKKIVQIKMKKTLLEKTGYENSSQNKETRLKRYKTLKQNNTFITSKYEEKAYNILKEKFPEVNRQYKSDKYPFACDFYIPELDLYIEMQICWTHGKMPYISQNKLCQEQLKKWQEKAKTSKFYNNAINTWTIRDLKKRQIAKNNKLNWFEFFTMKEFNQWVQSII